MVSTNGWPLLSGGEVKLWLIPDTNIRLPLRKSDAGFVLTHFAYNFHETVETLVDGLWDDHGWSPRYIAGTDKPSNHWSGTAVDLNSIQHPFGERNTFTKAVKLARLEWLLRTKYKGMIEWGGGWRTPDEMHFEITVSQDELRPLANELRKTAWGQKIRQLNAD
jgi:hypothetical protein